VARRSRAYRGMPRGADPAWNETAVRGLRWIAATWEDFICYRLVPVDVDV
jgi:hypothetical protein